jgi:hypothetical protein
LVSDDIGTSGGAVKLESTTVSFADLSKANLVNQHEPVTRKDEHFEEVASPKMATPKVSVPEGGAEGSGRGGDTASEGLEGREKASEHNLKKDGPSLAEERWLAEATADSPDVN